MVARTNVAAAAPGPDRRRWIALGVIALAQLMVALDATIVNIALPSAQRALGGTDADRQWVVTAYTLMFGALLLLGGRIADVAGRKRVFSIALAGFAAASALGGAAPTFAVLLAARALQGGFAALMTPTALSLLAVTFTGTRERARAFALYGAVAGSGGALGLLLGGALTEYASWRWCLYVNVLVAAIAGVAGRLVLPDTPVRRGLRFDLIGVLLAVAGLAAVIDACSRAVSDGWGSATVVSLLGAAGVLLTLFVVRQATAASPLLPLRIVLDRNRGGVCIAVAGAVAAMYGAFLLMTYEFQVVLRYMPLRAGLAFLPLSAAALASSGGLGTRLLPRVAPRLLIAPGLLTGAIGMLLLSRMGVDASYLGIILPAEVLLGGGMGLVFVPAFHIATLGVAPAEAGVASATVNTAQQVGGSIGTALLNTAAAGATAGVVATTASRAAALVHGYSVATVWGAAILAGAAALAWLLVKSAETVTSLSRLVARAGRRGSP